MPIEGTTPHLESSTSKQVITQQDFSSQSKELQDLTQKIVAYALREKEFLQKIEEYKKEPSAYLKSELDVCKRALEEVEDEYIADQARAREKFYCSVQQSFLARIKRLHEPGNPFAYISSTIKNQLMQFVTMVNNNVKIAPAEKSSMRMSNIEKLAKAEENIKFIRQITEGIGGLLIAYNSYHDEFAPDERDKLGRIIESIDQYQKNLASMTFTVERLGDASFAGHSCLSIIISPTLFTVLNNESKFTLVAHAKEANIIIKKQN